MKSFESVTIDTNKMLEMFIWEPFKIFLGVLFLTILGTLVYWLLTKETDFIGRKLPTLIILLFKVIVYGNLAVLIFFYDFNANKLTFEIPSRMLLSTAFVAVLAVYEAFSNVVEFFKLFMKVK